MFNLFKNTTKNDFKSQIPFEYLSFVQKCMDFQSVSKALLFAKTDTKVWHECILHGQAEVYFIEGRVKFFKNGVPAVITSKGPEKGFNRAIVTIRYQLAILPSTKLVTRLVEQEWVLEGEQWMVIPDLSTLLE